MQRLRFGSDLPVPGSKDGDSEQKRRCGLEQAVSDLGADPEFKRLVLFSVTLGAYYYVEGSE